MKTTAHVVLRTTNQTVSDEVDEESSLQLLRRRIMALWQKVICKRIGGTVSRSRWHQIEKPHAESQEVVTVTTLEEVGDAPELP